MDFTRHFLGFSYPKPQPYDPRYPCKGQDMAISKIISELNLAGVVRFRLHVLK